MSTLAPERQPDTRSLPLLESGDRLTRAEFERRYLATPPKFRAELVEGVVYVSSPVHFSHAKTHGMIVIALGAYVVATPGIDYADNGSLRIGADSEVQPDFCLWTSRSGVRLVPIGEQDEILEGAPELVVEVASSSASYDLHDKLDVYRRNGVAEYLVLMTYERELRWHVLREGIYQRLAPGKDGIYRSEVFPGLWLDAARFWAGDLAGVNAIIQQGLATPEHADFVIQLAAHS